MKKRGVIILMILLVNWLLWSAVVYTATHPLHIELEERQEHILKLEKEINTLHGKLQNRNIVIGEQDEYIAQLEDQNRALQLDLDQLVSEHEKYVRIDRNVDIPMAYKVHMYRLCNEYGVDYELALAVMVKESGGNPTALNTKNRNGTYDSGIMQINSTNHAWLSKELGIKDFNNPYDNMKAGVYMLSLFDYDNPHKILMAYNMGEGTMKRLFKQGTTSSKYSRDVMEIYNRIQE
jgi:hypothetical protein